MALVLAERHQEVVDLDPEVAGEDLGQGALGLLRRAGPHQAESIRNPVDMRVDADCRNAESQAEDQIRGLSTDAGESEQIAFVGWNLAVAFVAQNGADSSELSCLGPVKTRGIDGLRNPILLENGELRGVGREQVMSA